jgi:DNA-binding NtrC family response regulator
VVRSGETELADSFAALSKERHVSLVVRHGDHHQVEVLRLGQALTIGRQAPSDVVIPSALLSKQHARFSFEEGGLAVEDLGSKNGTLVGGQRVERAPLRAGDSLLMGDVAVGVHVFEPRDAALAGAMSHGRFVTLLEAEATRTRVLGSRAALLLVRHRDGKPAVEFLDAVQRLLKRSDSLSLYAPSIAEILLTDCETRRARELAQKLTESGLRCGGALLPDAASDAHELLARARSALDHPDSVERPRLRESGADDEEPAQEPRVVAQSDAMADLLRLVDRVANSVVPVLIHGETGTGKEVVARELHERSPRAKGPLRTLNCAALPQNLVEGALFGHERGAFTGADRQRKGLFEEAQGGTVFLDEIGELPLPAQATLLRVLENKVVTRVGGSAEIQVDVRIVAASHRRLEAMCEAGSFREDLWFRLNVVTLYVPPLREHPEDIEPLAELFLERAARVNARGVRGLSAAALRLLSRYAWPGNIRELRNEIERAVVICGGSTVGVEDLSDRVRGALETAPPSTPLGNEAPVLEARALRRRLRDHERTLIAEALAACGGNQTHAAEYLDIPRRTLVHKLRLHGLSGR